MTEVCEEDRIPLEWVEESALESALASHKGSVLLYLREVDFTPRNALAALSLSEATLDGEARRIGLLPFASEQAMRRYQARKSVVRNVREEKSIILRDEPHANTSSWSDGEEQVMTPLDGGLRVELLRAALAGPIFSLSGRANGRFNQIFLQEGSLQSDAKPGSPTRLVPSEILARHVFFNTCCSSIRQADRNLLRPFSTEFLAFGALSFIGSTRIHQGFPNLEYLHPRLLRLGYSTGEVCAILNAIIVNAGFDQNTFLLYGDPDVREMRFAESREAIEPRNLKIYERRGDDCKYAAATSTRHAQFYGHIAGPRVSMETWFVWSEREPISDGVRHYSNKIVEEGYAREDNLRLGERELSCAFPNKGDAIFGYLAEIRKKLAHNRRGMPSPLRRVSALKYSLKSMREFLVSYNEWIKMIQKCHAALVELLKTSQDTQSKAASSSNYYSIYSKYHERCPTVQHAIIKRACPYCQSDLFRREIAVEDSIASRRILTCPLDFIIADDPITIGPCEPLRIQQKSYSGVRSHKYQLDFHNMFNHSVQFLLVPSITYINDQCHSAVIDPILITLDRPAQLEVLSAKTERWQVTVSCDSLARINMYILQVFAFADLRFHFAAANFIRPLNA